VEEKILVELKVITQLENVHLAPAINYNYIEAFELEIALLINSGLLLYNSVGSKTSIKYLIKDHLQINKSQFRQ
jgi:hypothetical protein